MEPLFIFVDGLIQLNPAIEVTDEIKQLWETINKSLSGDSLEAHQHEPNVEMFNHVYAMGLKATPVLTQMEVINLLLQGLLAAVMETMPHANETIN